tara:strand:- start:592 stop:1011 length:420 start_codon:yes stop_codon:yes gene_type:complete
MKILTEEFIAKIENETSKDEAYFDLNLNQDNEHFQANKDGLKLFASLLLKIAYNKNPDRSEVRENLYNINNNEFFDKNGTNIFWIDLVDKPKSQISRKDFEYKKTWKDKLFEKFLAVFLLFLLACIIVGFIKFVQWIFF